MHYLQPIYNLRNKWNRGRVAEGARLESVFRGNSNVGSNPTDSANCQFLAIYFILKAIVFFALFAIYG
jgi:hypothetical protein